MFARTLVRRLRLARASALVSLSPRSPQHGKSVASPSKKAAKKTFSFSTASIEASKQKTSDDEQQSDRDSKNYERAAFHKMGRYALGFIASVAVPSLVAKKHVNHKNEDAANKAEVIVFTWNPVEGNIGHQAMLIKEANGKSTYISFWPSDADAAHVGMPFGCFLASNGKFEVSLQGDVKTEGNREPDSMLIIHNLDADAMKKMYAKMQNDLKHNRMGYAFVPHLSNLLGLAPHPDSKDASVMTHIAEDHLFGAALDNAGKRYKGHNCTSVINTVLVAGNFPWRLNLTPWGDTPVGQQVVLKHLGAEEVTDPVVKESLINSMIVPASPASLTVKAPGKK